ncbi:MAG: hypothetical protein PeribacterA2_0335 [Candidatus Peribacter riflensis]|uniref:Uncharacterized protein n=1 Tax=Candidatus Peribacter riflensis TaxID=1735162 RepID=A0A0S1SVJ1_9BACT|nr:MAG: hypothetical protein PeribacterA2_0335 [Candidatus Peribacter riflensis]OGJ78299.1 MAG: hypothetical protein A2398_05435 [Candidatus Peribacteria bacterium RIFOXYB1_FULL_57_12]OGJ82378.1 MAG: hypothetical protein A2412_03670 [Candidatus Peribacteria bacterium RIFOXYC1_FULL_58_8]ALM10828.1 MAG: hypothetical protein PeribacterB2_0335 [Candidatus Peribacter riflensis]ALM11930.1 MAG: hypothetical protein PeribacterC2_0334 [Candidatus Peribacter riflensis]
MKKTSWWVKVGRLLGCWRIVVSLLFGVAICYMLWQMGTEMPTWKRIAFAGCEASIVSGSLGWLLHQW